MGNVSVQGVPTIALVIAKQEYVGIIDTGFNGTLQLPDGLFDLVDPLPYGTVQSMLANGEVIDEEVYLVNFPFDGQTILAEATFCSDPNILIGTGLLVNHRLEIVFPAKTVRLERVA